MDKMDLLCLDVFLSFELNPNLEDNPNIQNSEKSGLFLFTWGSEQRLWLHLYVYALFRSYWMYLDLLELNNISVCKN